jgi:hypothetical protein
VLVQCDTVRWKPYREVHPSLGLLPGDAEAALGTGRTAVPGQRCAMQIEQTSFRSGGVSARTKPSELVSGHCRNKGLKVPNNEL